jgi:hypothetical protein
MGQYHILANLDNFEFVKPSDMGAGSKQYEHTFYNGDLAHAMYLLTMTSPERGGGDWPITLMSGRWAGCRVVILGDYTEDGDLPDFPNASTLYKRISYEGVNITPEVVAALTNVTEPMKAWSTL